MQAMLENLHMELNLDVDAVGGLSDRPCTLLERRRTVAGMEHEWTIGNTLWTSGTTTTDHDQDLLKWNVVVAFVMMCY